MPSFVQPEGNMKARIIAKQKFKFIVDANIIETLIFGLLFDNLEEEGEEDNSIHMAKKDAFKTFVRNDEDNTFVFEVKSILKLNMIANFWLLIFKNIWAFAIAMDAGNNAGTAYLDLRMRCCHSNA
ncbi:hypothetical protein IV203_023647 [Nitzschia inconspicua]|uniref:Uncharacterized protein n=1 Tax=Nitzschia inconspicua TaxID=303405 RepID=A0A9K3KEB2_9STRA|nr:hypothetical protein IV203_023647 [Nitzschia inconspicua]